MATKEFFQSILWSAFYLQLDISRYVHLSSATSPCNPSTLTHHFDGNAISVIAIIIKHCLIFLV